MPVSKDSNRRYRGDFIKHAGKKGMRWGVWNADTRRKYDRLGISAKQSIPSMASGGGSVDEETDIEDAYEELMKTAKESENSSEFLKNLGKRAYDSTLKGFVDENVGKIRNVLDKYSEMNAREISLTDDERSELRRKAKEEKKRRLQEGGGILW